MDRRKFITAFGTVILTSGCSSIENSEETITLQETTRSPTTTETTQTPIPDESPTVTTPALEIKNIEIPDTAEIGEIFNLEVHIENSGNADGIWNAEIFDTATRGTPPENIDTTYSTWEPSLEVPAGESAVWKSPNIGYAEPCNAYFQVGSDGDIYEIRIPGTKNPIIARANVVSEWGDFGDVISNRIPVGESGSSIEFGFRFWYYEQKSLEVFEQVEIRDFEGNRVGLNQSRGEQLTEFTGWGQWENALLFDTTDWTPGTYTAEVIIRDERTGRVSEGHTTEFEIVEDLSDLQCTNAAVVDSDWPEQEPGNEPYDETPERLSVTIENTADIGGEITLETLWTIYGVLVKSDRNNVEIGAGTTRDVTIESTPPREGTPVFHQVVSQDCEY